MDPAAAGLLPFHASLMEPWDGPASVAFTDGTVVGAVLDRNGLRPGRWWRTSDGLVVLASEAGVLDLDPATVVAKGRLQPGRMFLVDTAAGRIIERRRDQGASWPRAAPYGEWLHAGLMHLEDLPEREHIVYTHDSVQRRQQTFGYTEEELKILLGADGAGRRRAARLDGHRHPDRRADQRPRLLYDYFPQLFAQVTNPPLDAIREEMVTSLAPRSARRATCSTRARPAAGRSCCRTRSSTTTSWPRSCRIDEDGDLPGFKAVRVSGLYPLRDGAAGIKAPADRDLPRTCPRRSRTACASWCSPTATPPPTWPRSRRCC